MGMTLDQLLDETGVSNLGRRHTKTAAPAKPDFAKLAERCRRAADATTDDHAASERHGLVEKTAAVEIIRRTMAEIAALDGGQPKTAAAVSDASADDAAFIRAALEDGHTPEAIAEFLEKQAAGGVRRFLGELGSGLKSNRAGRLGRAAEMAEGSAVRSWKSAAREYANLGDGDKMKFVEKLRRKFPDETVHAILKDNKDFHHLPGWKQLASAAAPVAAGAGAGAGGKALGVNIGGHQLGLTGKQLDKIKTPALYLGGGALAARAISGKSEPEKKKSGVVVVNS
ncbi:MAG: hypothetical protein KBF21_19150 [Thermoanaerobaculia bacterium]|nr:hypothetical protein [Thermoanaerobaculia bacterium]